MPPTRRTRRAGLAREWGRGWFRRVAGDRPCLGGLARAGAPAPAARRPPRHVAVARHSHRGYGNSTARPCLTAGPRCGD